MNFRYTFLAVLALSGCSSYRWFARKQHESPRSPLSKLGELRVQVMRSEELTRQPRIHSGSIYDLGPRGALNDKPWQWRDRNAIGAPPQSLVAPILLNDDEALFMTVGGGIERRNFHCHRVRWRIEVPMGVAAKPYINNNTVYFAGMDGLLRAVDVETGREKWKTKIFTESLGGIAGLQGNLYVTAADNSLWSVREDNGEVVWTYKRPAPEGPVIWSLRGQATPAVSMDGKTIFVGFSDGVFVSLDALSGKTNWERRFERSGLFKDADTSPIVLRNNRAVVLPLVDGDLMALSVRDGTVLWTQKIGSFAPPLYDAEENKLYVPGGDGTVYRLSAETGVSEWTRSLGFKGLATQPTFVASKFIAFTTSHFGLVILNKNNGQQEYEFSMGSGSTTPVTSNGKYLLALNSRNILTVFKTEDRKSSQYSRLAPR